MSRKVVPLSADGFEVKRIWHSEVRKSSKLGCRFEIGAGSTRKDTLS